MTLSSRRYLGDGEMDPYMKRLLEPLGVECVDAREIEKQNPCRILCGWELKLFATLHSPFAHVLFLDADNGVVCDPTYLFDCEEYQRHGAVFWPDYACWTLKPGVWRIFGMPDMAEPGVAEHERAFESGQYLIDKRRCDRELRLSLFYAEHSDFTFQHVYGDKECFHLGWRRLDSEYAMPSAGPGWNLHTIVQYDFRGQSRGFLMHQSVRHRKRSTSRILPMVHSGIAVSAEGVALILLSPVDPVTLL